MSTKPMTDLHHLADLADAATPGPWKHGPLFWEGWSEDDAGGVRVFEVPHVYPDGAHQPGVYTDPEIGREREADARFIAATRSVDYRALAELVEAAEAVLRDAFVGGDFLTQNNIPMVSTPGTRRAVARLRAALAKVKEPSDG